MIKETQRSDAQSLMERLQLIAADPVRAAEIGGMLIELRALTNGKWSGLLHELRPDLRRPDAWAIRCMEASRRLQVCVTDVPPQAETLPPPERSLEQSSVTAALDERAVTLYSRLRPLLAMAPAERSKQLVALASETRTSERTLWRKLDRLRAGGAAALNRKPRADRGKLAVPKEVEEAFLKRRLDPMRRHESVALAIRRIRAEFPDIEIPEHSLRRVARSIPAVATMPKEQWRKTFLPQGRWEAPYPNHTHTFDFTRGDVWVWDRDPEHEPYRPWLIFVVDECSRSLMWGLYTEETPSRATMQSVLLHAWLPKADPKWPQHGLPRYVHCDNGKVQASDWLREVCRTLNVDLGGVLDEITHTEPYSGFQQGKCERAHGIVHQMYEAGMGIAYCGSDPTDRPEECPGKTGGPRVWEQYPTLQSLNYGLHCWAVAEYHQIKHRTLKMSRQEAWLLRIGDHLRVADPNYLYTTLLQRAGTRLVRRGEIALNTFTYWHPRLQSYEGASLECRWDPSGLGKILVMDPDGQPLLWADRREVRTVGNPKDLAAWRADRRRAKAAKRVIQEAAETLAPADQGTFERAIAEMERAHEETVIPFPRRVASEKPEPPEEISADELLRLHADEQHTPTEKLMVFGIEV